MPIKAPTKAPTRASAATVRVATARYDLGRDTSSAFATTHTHGRTSFIPPRSKISLTFWESTGDAGQGRNSMVSSARWRGRTAPSSASSPITRLTLSPNRSLSATIVSGVSLRSRGQVVLLSVGCSSDTSNPRVGPSSSTAETTLVISASGVGGCFVINSNDLTIGMSSASLYTYLTSSTPACNGGTNSVFPDPLPITASSLGTSPVASAPPLVWKPYLRHESRESM